MPRPFRFPPLFVFALVLLTAAGGAAYAQNYDVRGVVDAVKSHVSIFINGKEVIQRGILDLSTRQQGKGTISETAVFPLKGTYEGKPVAVRCYNTPWTSDIYCQVDLAGRQIKILTFYQPSPDGKYRAN